MSTDEQLAETFKSLGLVGGCLVCIVVLCVPLSIAALLAPVTGVECVEDLFDVGLSQAFGLADWSVARWIRATAF